MLRPVKITEVSSTPSSVPFRLPWPPIRLVPPMTNGGDNVELHPHARHRLRGTRAADNDDCRQSYKNAGDNINAQRMLFHIDTGRT